MDRYRRGDRELGEVDVTEAGGQRPWDEKFNGGAGLNSLIFSLAAGAIVALLIFWLSRATSPFLAFAIGLIIGGAAGNVIDRLRLGAVVDFLDFHVQSLHWPAFNLADSAICIGVAAMLLDGLVVRREAH